MRIAAILIALFLAPVPAFADAGKGNLLVGHWRYADQNQSCTYTLRKDGTFAGEVKRKGEATWKFAGRWSLTGDVLNYSYTKSSLDRVPAGSVDQDKLIEITKDHLVLITLDGSRRKYTRIGSDG